MLRRCRYGTDHPTPAPARGSRKQRVRSSSAHAEWLAIAKTARNAQLSPIVIHPEHPRHEPDQTFEPFKLGPITLPNRLVMAPLTRNRAVPPGMVPSPLAVDYYAQRASAGLLITEASQVSQQGQGYQDTPGIYSKEQVAGWRKVTDRVHEQGGRIFIQLWHVGRISHDFAAAGGGKPVAPSAIRAKGKTFVNGTFTDISEPRALELSEILGIIEDFKRGTENAMAAGFDGVEIHGANGYLLDQFAKDGINKRTDAYGGSTCSSGEGGIVDGPAASG